MKSQRIGKVCLLKQGCVVSRFFSVWFTVTGAMKIFCYTEDFFIYGVHAEVIIKSRFPCACTGTNHIPCKGEYINFIIENQVSLLIFILTVWLRTEN